MFTEAFFDAYEQYLVADWGEDDESDPSEIGQLYQLHPSVIGEQDVVRIETTLGKTLPKEYREFLLAYAYEELYLPWLEFPSTVDERAKGKLLPYVTQLKRPDLVVFAQVQDDEDVFCLDYGHPIHAGQPSVALFRSGFPEGKNLIRGVFSDFAHVLTVLTKVMNSEVPVYVEDAPSEEQLRFFEELRKTDPQGFGGPGWEQWWAYQLRVKRHTGR